MPSKAKTASEYLAECPAERKAAMQAVYDLMKESISAGYEEAMRYGMISFEVPLSVYPNTYNKQPAQLAALANQKGYMSLYLVSPMVMPELQKTLMQSGKKLKMGKSCINFNELDELPLDDIKEVLKRSEMTTFVAAIKAAQTSRKAEKESTKAAKSPAKKK